MKYASGVPCPGCGLTRAFISISSGQFVRAWNFNPASFAMYAFIAGQIPWRIYQIWRVKIKKIFSFHRTGLYLIPALLGVVLIGQWIWRLLSQ